jgi:hypothetical protein
MHRESKVRRGSPDPDETPDRKSPPLDTRDLRSVVRAGSGDPCPTQGGNCDRLKPGLQQREEATMNVQIASGCIKNWYESSEGVSRCQCEVLLWQRIAAMPLPVADEARTLKSGISAAVDKVVVSRRVEVPD